MRFTREECLKRLKKVISQGRPIVGAGAGAGISAKSEEMGGADLIIIYNSGYFRMAGRPSLYGILPVGDANGLILEMAGEVLPVVKNTPVLAGVFAHDNFRVMDLFLKQLIELGFSGIQNIPSYGQWAGSFKWDMDQAGFTYEAEAALIAKAHDLGLLTTPYAWTEDQARLMAKAKADLIVAHMGVTGGGTVGYETISLEQAAKRAQKIHDAIKSVNPETLVLCHGGPVSEPEDFEYILKNTEGIAGFYGASSMERLPVERAISQQVRRFKDLKI
jgi:predicted TIM-barrel enzyme